MKSHVEQTRHAIVSDPQAGPIAVVVASGDDPQIGDEYGDHFGAYRGKVLRFELRPVTYHELRTKPGAMGAALDLLEGKALPAPTFLRQKR